ncbi:Multicopper oxidase [Acidisarcina polymorpha]|uniref:Multicopper oxidase n=1 Tax=Acidisarcina polymorpha TaxID=2211140 RepID=A0A2Z5FTW6_9BACT|nr:multicopper oxidase family protein [Acidisarcina polymorpha]AXC10281.1 Multicopper oxidase [Acidisarcina polymorpha]
MMKRRDLLKLAGITLAGTGARRLPLLAQTGVAASPASVAPARKADYTLHIAPVTVELDRSHILSTIGYNGVAPGPVLRMREGKPVVVDVINDTDTPELVHWHGMLLPAELDGTGEEGSPPVPPHGRHRFELTPRPTGTRWYHSHAMAMDDLHKGSYTGQFGFVHVEGESDPGQYDQELFLALRDWEPFFTGTMEDDDDDSHDGPLLEKPPTLNTDPDGLEVGSVTYSINDKALGSGEPIRVREGQRVLIHFLNASAIENRRIALAGHKMRVIALDGNPVPSPQSLDSIFLGAGERVDVIIEMKNPGVWVLGATEKVVRESGLGVIVEYAGQHRQPLWTDPQKTAWDYTIFGAVNSNAPPPQQTLEMIFEKIPGGAGKFNSWLINGKPYPHEQEFVLQQGMRYRLVMRNRTDDAHPMHLHRHLWELAEINGKKTSGILKDTVIVPYYGRAVVDFTADQPGLSLFHCHIQQHMDYGFKALFRSA